MSGAAHRLRLLWRWLRALSGDDAYERYLTRHGRRHPDVPPLTPGDFYLQEQRRKWSGVSRCC